VVSNGVVRHPRNLVAPEPLNLDHARLRFQARERTTRDSLATTGRALRSPVIASLRERQGQSERTLPPAGSISTNALRCEYKACWAARRHGCALERINRLRHSLSVHKTLQWRHRTRPRPRHSDRDVHDKRGRPLPAAEQPRPRTLSASEPSFEIHAPYSLAGGESKACNSPPAPKV